MLLMLFSAPKNSKMPLGCTYRGRRRTFRGGDEATSFKALLLLLVTGWPLLSWRFIGVAVEGAVNCSTSTSASSALPIHFHADSAIVYCRRCARARRYVVVVVSKRNVVSANGIYQRTARLCRGARGKWLRRYIAGARNGSSCASKGKSIIIYICSGGLVVRTRIVIRFVRECAIFGHREMCIWWLYTSIGCGLSRPYLKCVFTRDWLEIGFQNVRGALRSLLFMWVT